MMKDRFQKSFQIFVGAHFRPVPTIIWGIYFRTDQDLSEKSSISSNSDDEDGDEKKMKEISKAEEAGINDNNGNENEAFEEESF